MAAAVTSHFQTLQRLLTAELRWRVRTKELLLFYTQMAILLESGTSVPLALEALEKQLPGGVLRQVVGELKRRVHEGHLLSQAMAQYPRVFSPVYVGMVRAGESGGFLVRVFQRIVLLQEQRQELRTILASALAYPALLVLIGAGVVVFMTTVILPKFLEIYATTAVALPLLTRLVLGLYALLAGSWFLWLPLLLAGLALAIYLARRPQGKALVDTLLVTSPGVGALVRQVYLERLLRTLGVLLDSGVPLYDALLLTRSTLGNHCYRQLLTAVVEGVREGQGLARLLAQSPLVPPTVRQMVQTGEAAGTLGTVLTRVADFYFGRVREQVRLLARLAEPVATLLVGSVVGTVALALVLPILQLARTLHPS
ncbi:MAG: type II secretion system protein GspF [Candidatus Tectimicrobiota bacterium]|nr:MAG: type II secretion system protein GspF [Candidatus Tectomicrobia bacterium]